MISIDWLYCVSAAAIAVGVIEYIKGWFKAVPGWAWRLLVPFVAAGVAIAGGGAVHVVATNALAITALTQIGYEAFLRFLKKKVEGA